MSTGQPNPTIKKYERERGGGLRQCTKRANLVQCPPQRPPSGIECFLALRERSKKDNSSIWFLPRVSSTEGKHVARRREIYGRVRQIQHRTGQICSFW